MTTSASPGRKGCCYTFGDAEHFIFAKDQVFLAIQLDLGARVFADQDVFTRLHVEREHLTLVVHTAAADGDDFCGLRLFLRRVRDDDSADALLRFLDPLGQNAIA